jgi:hypothetical protein
MTKKQDERRSFSYHEAGHAVVAWSLGFRVSKVSIGMDGNDGPVTELDAVLPPRPSQALIINRGGMAAEDLFDALTSSRACVWASVPRCCNCPLPPAPNPGRIRRRRRFASLRFLPDGCARNGRRNFGRPREQIVEEAAAQVENLLFNKPLSDGQNLFRRFNHIWSIHKATAFKSLR